MINIKKSFRNYITNAHSNPSSNAVYISQNINILWKGLNPTILSQGIGK